MMIDPEAHLSLHRQLQHERDRRLSHLTSFRATRTTADAISAGSPATASPRQRLLRAGRWRPTRRPTTPAGPTHPARMLASSTVPQHDVCSSEYVTDGSPDRAAAKAPASC